jgi:hypothetical protein
MVTVFKWYLLLNYSYVPILCNLLYMTMNVQKETSFVFNPHVFHVTSWTAQIFCATEVVTEST